ncbi:uncharacterized protein LTR77_007918 [Saxophila tyrrhenica]|uniref:Nucleotide-diphospho-sugar transferase n=1 Tax=Saxophila tyrrhenica TaxID=1690608 RepID=A0AAV9P6R3_9PEZI|nr:hypothetical protein LTR77_007918 [Saxophila tyrrhenica]
MPVDFLAKWKSTVSEALPLQNMDRLMSSWKYAPVGESEEGNHPSKRSFFQNARECLNSKAFWRTFLVIASILLLANLFSPVQQYAKQRGWFPEGPDQEGSSEGSEVLDKPIPKDGIDWSQYAYCQYVTNEDYLCNSLMIFESLTRLRAKAENMMMYPEDWTVGDNSNHGRLLAQARDEYNVRLVPIQVERMAGDPTWAESFTKLLAFNQTMYKRVLSLDSDATVLQPMDELFLLPSAPVGMPRAYWLDQPFLSSQLVLIEPSKFEFARIERAFAERGNNDFDMEIVNDLYGSSCFIIPHRKYDLLTGEFKSQPDQHAKYLGSTEEKWESDRILEEAKFLHFSDWPYPKPWIGSSQASTEQNMPDCHGDDCADQKNWLWFYSDFRERRARICGEGFKRKRDVEAELFEPASSPATGLVFNWR